MQCFLGQNNFQRKIRLGQNYSIIRLNHLNLIIILLTSREDPDWGPVLTHDVPATGGDHPDPPEVEPTPGPHPGAVFPAVGTP